ncbi:hypothetical protein RB195_013498 [Necator americanus]|uniref:Uncharacterized protein n=1 Tax=Necator americanus TaxID=51031 RepID=A0ABR1DVT2_NECAM
MGLQKSFKLPKRKRSRRTIITYNARALASEAAIEGMIMQARKIMYDVKELTKTRRSHQVNAVHGTGGEPFLRICYSRGVDVLVDTSIELSRTTRPELVVVTHLLRSHPKSIYKDLKLSIWA